MVRGGAPEKNKSKYFNKSMNNPNPLRVRPVT